MLLFPPCRCRRIKAIDPFDQHLYTCCRCLSCHYLTKYESYVNPAFDQSEYRRWKNPLFVDQYCVFYLTLLFRTFTAGSLMRVVVFVVVVLGALVFRKTADRWRLCVWSFADALLTRSPSVFYASWRAAFAAGRRDDIKSLYWSWSSRLPAQ